MIVKQVQPYQNIVKFWRTDKYPNAKELRDNEAKELRKQGYKVTTQKIDFTDLLRCTVYRLEY